jgi:outer membrane receptor protein involved in Fe transport
MQLLEGGKMKRRSFGCSRFAQASLVACLIVIASGIATRAQVSTADILGKITDSSGASMPQTQITITNLGTSEARTATSDDNGDYVVTLLPVGHYSVKIERSGFKVWTVEDVAVSAGDRLRLDATLQVGTVQQTIEVTAQSPALQTDTSTTGTLVDDRAVQDLPTNGRNFVTLVQLAAGAADSTVGFSGGTATDDRRLTSQVQVNGQFAFDNNFMIDGMDDNERFIGTVTVKPSIESIQEMKVTTTVYSADLGRTAGGVINMITKSGTNQFHGSAYDFVRNQIFDARNFFAKPPADLVKPPYRQNQYGGSIGGPIRKDNTFFYMDYEALRLGQNTLPVTSTVPIANGVAPVNVSPTGAVTPACPAGSPATTCLPYSGSGGARSGNFTGYSGNIYNPLSCNVSGCARTQFAGDVIPSAMFDHAGLALLDLYPLPNQGVPGQLANNYLAIPVTINNEDTADVRVDHKFSDSDSIFGRYTIADIRVFIPGNVPPVADGTQTNERTQGAMIDYVHTFNPRLLGELKFGYGRYRLATVGNSFEQYPALKLLDLPNANIPGDPRQSQFPAFSFNGNAASSTGDAGFNPEFNTNNTWDILGSILKQWGAHSIKIGGNYRKRLDSQNQQQSSNGSFAFSSLQTQAIASGSAAAGGNALASLILGFPNAVTQQKQLNVPGYRFTESAIYVQDDWRARNWLTLNLGLRYDYFSPLTEVHDQIANFVPALQAIVQAGTNGVGASDGVTMGKLNFSPRIGFAASVTRRTVVRGGFGMTYVPFFMGTFYALRNAPFIAAFSNATGAPYPNFSLSGNATCGALCPSLPLPVPVSAANPFGTVDAVMPHLDIPYLYQSNLFVQQDVGAGLVASIGYIGILGRQQPFPNASLDINEVAPGNPSTVQQRRPYFSKFPNMQQLYEYGNFTTTSYQGLQASLERRFKSGFGAVVNYTYSHALDNFEYQPLTQYVAGAPLTGFRLDTGNSSIDLRQRFTVTANYQLPFARNSKGLLQAAAQGWQLNVIGQLQTGLPFSVTNNNDQSGTNNEGGARPNVIGNPYTSGSFSGSPASCGTPPTIVHTTQLTSAGALVPWYNPCAFAPQTVGTYGNEGRLQLFGPRSQSWALSANKDFHATERLTFQFRAEFFNVFNHPNFATPNAVLGSASTGTITASAPGSLGLARNIQFALKLLF